MKRLNSTEEVIEVLRKSKFEHCSGSHMVFMDPNSGFVLSRSCIHEVKYIVQKLNKLNVEDVQVRWSMYEDEKLSLKSCCLCKFDTRIDISRNPFNSIYACRNCAELLINYANEYYIHKIANIQIVHVDEECQYIFVLIDGVVDVFECDYIQNYVSYADSQRKIKTISRQIQDLNEIYERCTFSSCYSDKYHVSELISLSADLYMCGDCLKNAKYYYDTRFHHFLLVRYILSQFLLQDLLLYIYKFPI